MDSLDRNLTVFSKTKQKSLFHGCSNLNCQTLLSWLHLHIHSLMTFPYYPCTGSLSIPECICFLYFLFNLSILVHTLGLTKYDWMAVWYLGLTSDHQILLKALDWYKECSYHYNTRGMYIIHYSGWRFPCIYCKF